MSVWVKRIGGRLSCVLALVAIVGCNVLPSIPLEPGACGISFAIWLRTPATSQYEYFTVCDGEYRYGAGVDALTFKTSWGRALSEAECATLKQLAGDAGWFGTAERDHVDRSAGSLADVVVAWDGGRAQMSLLGSESGVHTIATFLRTLSEQRFERQLDRLPEAGKLK